MTHSSGPRFWPFLQKLEPIYWIRTLATLDWAGSSVRSKMMWSVSSHIVVALFGHHSGNIARRREILLATVFMCIQFRSYLRGAKLTIRTDHKSLVWLHRFKGTLCMMARWLHTLQQFSISSLLSTAPVVTTATPTGCPGSLLLHVVSVLAWIAHRRTELWR